MEMTYLKKKRGDTWPPKRWQKKERKHIIFTRNERWNFSLFIFLFTKVKKKQKTATMATAKRHNMERHFTMCHTNYHANYSQGSTLWTEKVSKLKAALRKQQSFFTRPVKNSQMATEASFRAHFLIQKRKAFSDGGGQRSNDANC